MTFFVNFPLEVPTKFNVILNLCNNLKIKLKKIINSLHSLNKYFQVKVHFKFQHRPDIIIVTACPNITSVCRNAKQLSFLFTWAFFQI